MIQIKYFYTVLFIFEFTHSIAGSADIYSSSIIHYYGPNIENNDRFELYKIPEIINSTNFKKSNPTTLYIHGYLENQTVGSVPAIVNAYLNRSNINLLVLDWEKAAGGDYIIDAVPNVKKLGPIVASFLVTLIQNGLNLDNFHVVGHSLGGQLSGLIGRTIKSISNNTIVINRISGLDPASIAYYLLNEQLSAKDANFVDIIHTDAFGYGLPYSIGTVDFWPNRGISLQPGCPFRNHIPLTDNDLCSHRRSWTFWAENVSGKYVIQFLANNEKHLQAVPMGIDCPKNVKGNFFLKTNGSPPYAKGSEGLVDWNSIDSVFFEISEVSHDLPSM